MARHRSDANVDVDALPEVLFLEDVAVLLRCSPSGASAINCCYPALISF